MALYERPRLPLFFKLWFAFVALLSLSVIALVVYMGVEIVRAGPEGIGHEIGRFLGAIEEGRAAK